MSLIKVIHKVRAYIEGRTYSAGEEGLIDEVHFNESVHDKVDKEPATNETPPEDPVAPPPPVEPAPIPVEAAPTAYGDSGPVKAPSKKSP